VRDQIEMLVEGFIGGRLTREELINQLVTVTDDDSGRSEAESTFRSIGLNHVALSVSNVDAMAQFMGEHLGTTVIRSTDSAAFLSCGNNNNFVGLFRSDPTGLNHVCFSVEGYDPDDAAERIRSSGLEPHRNEDRVFFTGPDGVIFQVASTWGDYPTA
jgi:catechol 2,3-dioxygenase-like lactoylglutathione lyase family enzyme